jgi:hypothetical protein
LEEAVEKTSTLSRSQKAKTFTNLQQIIILTELISERDTSKKRSKEIYRAVEEDLRRKQEEQ